MDWTIVTVGLRPKKLEYLSQPHRELAVVLESWLTL